MRLQGALDSEVLVCAQKFLENGIRADVDSLYTAIQRSNSSLKRKPKKVIQASLERVLEAIGVDSGDDGSDGEIEKSLPAPDLTTDVMNRSLRANLQPVQDAPSAVLPSRPGNVDSVGEAKRRLPNGEPHPKRQRAEPKKPTAPDHVSLRDVGGLDGVLQKMADLLVLPLLNPQKYRDMNIPIPKGIMLHGPPGCGKTMLVRAFASAMGLPFVEILGPSIVSGMSGESEKGVREKFEEARKHAPCLLFIDEIDSIAPKRESSQSQMEKRIVAQLLVSMDELDNDPTKPVIVLAATNRPDSLDPALRRGGRFDTEINIGVPDQGVREQILRVQMQSTPTADDIDFRELAKLTAGFVGADLHDLVGKAGAYHMDRYSKALTRQSMEMDGNMDVDSATENRPVFHRIESLIKRVQQPDIPEPPGFENETICMADFLAVLPHITPSSKREGFTTIPDVSWDDVGALLSVRKKLQASVVEPIKNPERYARLGLSASSGVLLWGPPGCGKTLLAKAAAAESKANFISIKGPELINKFVGESEAAVRRVFSRARSSVPCVIFFDELDALAPRRDDASSEATARVVNTLLTELDGLSERKGIFVIGATNRPDIIDDAMLRPGRLQTPLFVDLPGANERVDILRTILRTKPVEDMDAVLELARSKACDSFSGADLGALWTEAATHAVQREAADTVGLADFQHAATCIKGSVGNIRHYHALRKKFAENSGATAG